MMQYRQNAIDKLPPFPAPVLDPLEYMPVLRGFLAEDLGKGDLTGQAVIPPTATARLALVAREPLVVAGLPLAFVLFRETVPDLATIAAVSDGILCQKGETLAILSGNARGLLAAERTALNLLQALSAIATLTRQYVGAMGETQARLLDTRKTVPGLRLFSKYAASVGGAWNHRLRLDDALMLKDNHIALCGGSLTDAIHQARTFAPDKRLIVECDTLIQAEEALAAGADWLLLDNMSPDQLRQGVQLARGRAVVEASGGVRLDTIATIAATGVDYISCGRITQDAGSVDIGLDTVQ